MTFITRASLLSFAFIIVLFTAVGRVEAQWWNPFAQSDYEECEERAARDAKSKEALQILIGACETKFTGRRKIGGGYTFFDPRQGRRFDIKGPNPTAPEMKEIELAHQDYLEAQRKRAEYVAELDQRNREQRAAQEQQSLLQKIALEKAAKTAQEEFEKRSRAALGGMQILSKSIKCHYPFLHECEHFTLTLKIKNNSREPVSSVSIGWAFLSDSGETCPSSLQTKKLERIRLSPNDTAVLNLNGFDGPKTDNVHYCAGVTAVDLQR